MTADDTAATVHHASGTIMGGPWQLRHRPQPGIDPGQVAAAALDALRSVDTHMSHYKPESDLMRLNRTPVGQWCHVDASLIDVMAAADNYRCLSHGALDISLGDAINAWGFGPDAIPEHCPAAMPQKTPDCHPMRDYQWQTQPAAVKRNKAVTFNLSALAKGYAVDCAAEAVRALGVEHFLIEAAGEIYAQGTRPGGHPWQIGLELPVVGRCLVYDTLTLDSEAVATSGGYRKYHHIDKRSVIHAFDPNTATPIESDLLAVSIIADTCMRADALATALFVQGAAAGSAFADTHNIAALFLLRSEDGICEIRSRAWMARL